MTDARLEAAAKVLNLQAHASATKPDWTHYRKAEKILHAIDEVDPARMVLRAIIDTWDAPKIPSWMDFIDALTAARIILGDCVCPYTPPGGELGALIPGTACPVHGEMAGSV